MHLDKYYRKVAQCKILNSEIKIINFHIVSTVKHCQIDFEIIQTEAVIIRPTALISALVLQKQEIDTAYLQTYTCNILTQVFPDDEKCLQYLLKMLYNCLRA